MAHPFDEKQGRLTGDAVPIAEGIDSDNINARAVFSASPNGALIYRTGTASGGCGRLTWFDRSGKTLGTVAENGFYRSPRVSPDGQHVVVTFSKGEAGMDLWQIDLARGVPTRSTFQPENDVWPGVFMQRHIGGGLHAYAIDPSGQRFLLVVPDQKEIPPITVFVNWPSLLSKK